MSGAYPLSCRSLVRPAIAFPSGMNCADECRYAQFMATINEEKKVLQVLWGTVGTVGTVARRPPPPVGSCGVQYACLRLPHAAVASRTRRPSGPTQREAVPIRSAALANARPPTVLQEQNWLILRELQKQQARPPRFRYHFTSPHLTSLHFTYFTSVCHPHARFARSRAAAA